MTDTWIITFTNIDPSRNATLAYRDRAEALGVAAEFVKGAAQRELEDIDWEDEEAPTMLRDVLAKVDVDPAAAIMGWLEYQQEYDPSETIALGPSGAVSASPGDFAC